MLRCVRVGRISTAPSPQAVQVQTFARKCVRLEKRETETSGFSQRLMSTIRTLAALDVAKGLRRTITIIDARPSHSYALLTPVLVAQSPIDPLSIELARIPQRCALEWTLGIVLMGVPWNWPPRLRAIDTS